MKLDYKANYMNEFLTLLLPWKETSNDQISDYFVYGIFALFGILLVIFLWKTIRRIRLISGLNKKIDKLGGEYDRPADPGILNELEEIFNRSDKFFKPFNKAWQEFRESLITPDRRKVVYKTDEASLFFSEERLIEQYMNLRFWNSVSTILVGLGILGTFVGLVSGLEPFSKIDFGDTENIQDNIQDAIKILLSGASTAFVTSVWGMLASLLFNWLEKGGIGMVSRKIANLQGALDLPFTLKTQEEIAEKQKDELEQQTQALKAFSTDLADKIKIAMNDIMSEKFDDMHQSLKQSNGQNVQESQEIIQALHKLPENISDVVETKLSPNLKNIDVVVEELQGQSKLIDRLDQNLINFSTHSVQSKQEIVDELQKLISSTAQIETSVETVCKVCESMVNLPKLLEQITDDIHNVLNQKDDKFERRLAGMDDFFDRTAQNLQDIQQKSIKLLQLQNERIENINAQLANSQTILDKGREMFEQMDESVTSVRQLIETTKSLSGTLKVGADQLETAGRQLTQASSMFNIENAKYLKANRETTQQIQSALAQSHQMLNDFAQNFETIDNSLKGIFEEIEKGLNTYADITRKSIDKYLEKFSEQLADASNALSGSINALKESVVILNDVIDQLRNS